MRLQILALIHFTDPHCSDGSALAPACPKGGSSQTKPIEVKITSAAKFDERFVAKVGAVVFTEGEQQEQKLEGVK